MISNKEMTSILKTAETQWLKDIKHPSYLFTTQVHPCGSPQTTRHLDYGELRLYQYWPALCTQEQWLWACGFFWVVHAGETQHIMDVLA